VNAFASEEDAPTREEDAFTMRRGPFPSHGDVLTGEESRAPYEGNAFPSEEDAPTREKDACTMRGERVRERGGRVLQRGGAVHHAR
jgi:hypothetical protein